MPRGAKTHGREIQMPVNLKVLGLALVAVFAISAVAVSAAAAKSTHHFDGVGQLSVEENSTQKLEATTGGKDFVTCGKVKVHGSINGTTDKITVTPTFEECTAVKGETEAAVFYEPGGCDFQFTGKTTEGNPTGGEFATVHIQNHEDPEKSCHLQFKVTAFKLKCISVPNQTIPHAVEYSQTGGSDTTITLNTVAHGVENTTTNSIACPTGSGGTEVHENGAYLGSVDVVATNEIGGKEPFTLKELVTD
jgi:hypothetical protein